MNEKSKRGLASASLADRQRVASMGGKAAHKAGTAHKFNSEEARIAGKKGGMAISQNKDHMSEIGRKGGKSKKYSHETK